MIPEVEGTRPWGPPRKRVPKCLKGPETTYTSIAIAEKQSKRSKKGPFSLYLGSPWFHPGNGIYGARRGRSFPVPPPPPGFSGHVLGRRHKISWVPGRRVSQLRPVTASRFSLPCGLLRIALDSPAASSPEHSRRSGLRFPVKRSRTDWESRRRTGINSLQTVTQASLKQQRFTHKNTLRLIVGLLIAN